MIFCNVVGEDVEGRLVDRSVVVEVVDGLVLVDVEGIVVVLVVELVDATEEVLVNPFSSLVVCAQK
jgi:hypothetical protein